MYRSPDIKTYSLNKKVIPVLQFSGEILKYDLVMVLYSLFNKCSVIMMISDALIYFSMYLTAHCSNSTCKAAVHSSARPCTR